MKKILASLMMLGALTASAQVNPELRNIARIHPDQLQTLLKTIPDAKQLSEYTYTPQERQVYAWFRGCAEKICTSVEENHGSLTRKAETNYKFHPRRQIRSKYLELFAQHTALISDQHLPPQEPLEFCETVARVYAPHASAVAEPLQALRECARKLATYHERTPFVPLARKKGGEYWDFVPVLCTILGMPGAEQGLPITSQNWGVRMELFHRMFKSNFITRLTSMPEVPYQGVYAEGDWGKHSYNPGKIIAEMVQAKPGLRSCDTLLLACGHHDILDDRDEGELSFSCHKRHEGVLTVTLDPSESPDVIADVNDERLWKGLQENGFQINKIVDTYSVGTRAQLIALQYFPHATWKDNSRGYCGH